MRRLLAPTVAALALMVACGDNTDTADTLAQTPATSGPAGSEPSAIPSGPLPEGCPPDDGSAPKQQQFDAPPPMCLDAAASYRATITTSLGTLRVDLRADIAPNTVNSFVFLARNHYFDGTTCHRAIQGFVVQCGDPTATGSGGPGYLIGEELDRIEPYQVGSLAMAKTSGATEHGSQFFLITGPNGTALPQEYTLFGQVAADDLDELAALDAVANPNDGPPLTPIDIASVTVEVTS
jgi:cyclophilin family peptidyl-prolyl cis-trans isomerase